MSRYLTALAVLLGHGIAAAQIIVPKDWKPIGDTPHPESELVWCIRQAGASFRVAFDEQRLTATVMTEPDRTDHPAPYELDWVAALVERASAPRVAWAATYARERAERIVVPVDDGYLIGFGAGENGGSLWVVSARARAGSQARAGRYPGDRRDARARHPYRALGSGPSGVQYGLGIVGRS